MLNAMLNCMQKICCFIQLSGQKRSAINFKLISTLLNNGPRSGIWFSTHQSVNSYKPNNLLTRYYIQGKEVKHSTSSGVTIDEHVKAVTSKANKVKGFFNVISSTVQARQDVITL